MNRFPTLHLLFLLLAVLLSAILPLSAQAQNLLPSQEGPYAYLEPPPGEQPVRVAMTFHLDNIHSIDDEAETFDLSGILTLRWLDPRQSFDPAEVGAAEKVFTGNYQFNEISPGWFPQVVLTNAVGSPDSQGVVFRVARDGSSTVVQQFHATVRTGLALRRLPFDEQKLQLIFSVLGFDSDDIVLATKPNGATMNKDIIHVPEWHLSAISILPLSAGAGLEDFAMGSTAVAVQLEVERLPFFMVRLVVAPLALIVLLSWSVFWMDRSSLGDRMAVSFVGILTAVAYQSMVSDITPNIAYVTFLNAFMVMSMFLMSVTVGVNLIVAACDKRGDVVLGNRIDRTCRWVFPLAYAVLICLSFVATFFVF